MVFYVTMLPFHMTLLMYNWTNIVMDDGWVLSTGQTPYLLLLATCDDILLWMIEVWMKNHKCLLLHKLHDFLPWLHMTILEITSQLTLLPHIQLYNNNSMPTLNPSYKEPWKFHNLYMVSPTPYNHLQPFPPRPRPPPQHTQPPQFSEPITCLTWNCKHLNTIFKDNPSLATYIRTRDKNLQRKTLLA